jgi:tRNA dimethylallyltransferase
MISPMNKTLVVLGGPTASGKSAVSIALAKHYRSVIISADSRQIYRETSIGTAVPSPGELATVPHYFIQTKSLNDYYNASMFENEVLQQLEVLFRERDIVFMVGGTGLYINAVCYGIDDLPTIDPVIREELATLFRTMGIEALREELKRTDPATYSRVDLNNHFRILKALEITRQTGKPYSSFLTHQEKARDFSIIRLALDMDRELLYNRINQRVDEMIERGLVEEVRQLADFRNKNAMKTVGYREIFSYLDNTVSLEEAIDLIKRNTRKYARKQLTWFRKDNLYPWFHPGQVEEMIAYIDSRTAASEAAVRK